MVKCMDSHIEVTLFGDSYRGYNVWRILYRIQCMDTHVGVTQYGEIFRVYNVWRIIYGYNVRR